ncbi:MAG: Gfo/Idh/MocA family oxidoreductase [Fimbriimonadaceae bacterium]
MQKIVLVGCGFMGRMHANVYALLENAELVACVDRRTEKAEAFAKDFGCSVFATMEEAVQATGASRTQVFFNAVWPAVLPQFVSK